MALNGTLVFDAVTHAFDTRPQNEKGRYAHQMNEANFALQWEYMPDPYRIPRDEYFRAFDAETLTRILFLESPTDIACYHTVPAFGVFHQYSPMSVALEIKNEYPDRLYCYGAVSPLEGRKAVEDIERQAEEWDIIGVKLYPVDFIDGELKSFQMSDQEMVYPVLERCQELGVQTVAIHKALPLGGAPMDAFRPGDVDYAAIDFPDLNFEIVHGGFAFLEETASQIHRLKNVFVNLEANTLWLAQQPLRFAHMLGVLLREGGPDKLFWGTGAMFAHPAPLLEAFDRLSFDDAMIDGLGYPPLTDDIKAKILSENYARVHNIDLDKVRGAVAGDGIAARRAEQEFPAWGGLRVGRG
jgi:predicted TIM-barrel fold metal-dependent hydrolase